MTGIGDRVLKMPLRKTKAAWMVCWFRGACPWKRQCEEPAGEAILGQGMRPHGDTTLEDLILESSLRYCQGMHCWG